MTFSCFSKFFKLPQWLSSPQFLRSVSPSLLLCFCSGQLFGLSSQAPAHWIGQTNAKSNIQTDMSHIQSHTLVYTKSRLPILCLAYSSRNVSVSKAEKQVCNGWHWRWGMWESHQQDIARHQCATSASKATVAGLWRWLSDGWGGAGWWANRSIHPRQHGRIGFNFEVFETWCDGGLIVCPCVRTAFAGDIYNAVEMAKQAPEERVLSLHLHTS